MTKGETINTSVDQADADIPHPCKNCGAQAIYHGALRAMQCPHCGHVESLGFDAIDIATFEIPIDQGLTKAQVDGLGTVTVGHCDNCSAQIEFGDVDITSHCAFCGKQSIIVKEDLRRPIRPQLVVPFGYPQTDAQASFSSWLGKLWFRPRSLKTLAKTESITGCYLPYWTFDSEVDSDWNADAGHYYYETESYSAFENGKWVRKTRTVRKIRWVPAYGSRSDAYDDVCVPASTRILDLGKRPAAATNFDLAKAQLYDRKFLSGYIAEEYEMDLPDALADAVEQMKESQRRRCVGDIPGDTYRFLRIKNHFHEQTFKLALLPVWLFAYSYRDKPYRFIMNGQTGEMWGRAPYSWLKILLLVVAIGALILAAILVFTNAQVH